MQWSILNAFVLFILVIIGVGELGSRDRTPFLVSAVNPGQDVGNSPQTPQKSSVTASLPQDSSGNVSTSGNDTNLITTSNYVGKVKVFLDEHRGVIYRSLIVLASVTGIVLVYLFIRWIGLRNRSKSKKYGLITTLPDDNLEMRPLDGDDDEDEDMTVFDRASQKTSRKPLQKK